MRRFRRDPARTVRLTIATLVAISAAMLAVSLDDTSTGFDLLHVAGLAALFTLGERVAFHLPSRRGAHTLTVVELAAVIGITLTAPAVYVAGRMIGSLVSVAGLRRQRGLRLWFNLANALLGSAIGASASAAFDIPSRPVTEAWPIVFAAVGIEALVLGLPVAFVISAHEPERAMGAILRELRVSWVASLSVAAIGVVVLVLAVEVPALAVLTAALGFAVILSVGSYADLYMSRQELDGVAALTARTALASGIEEMCRSIVSASTELLRSERGVIAIPDGTGSALVIRTSGDAVEPAVHEPLSEAARILVGNTRSIQVQASARSALGELLGADIEAPAVIAPLFLAGRTLGLVALASPAAPSTSYSETDLRLLETLTWHAATAVSRVLLEERLRKENDEKASIIRSKDQLIAAVSHKLRTPLTGILGFAEMLRDDRGELGDDSAQDITTTIADEALDLSFIVEDLLTAARHELGALAFHCTELDLAETVERSLPSVERRRSRPFLRSLPSIVAVYDGPRVRQIIRNLAANAVRYGGPTIEVSIIERDGRAAVVIRDDGDGVPVDQAEHVFDPYRSAHDPGTQPGSVGLGLTISREMARAMGGDLTYRRVDGWTEFALWLPIVSAPADLEPAEPSTLLAG